MSRPCQFPGCDTDRHAGGMCALHYHAVKRGALTLPDPERTLSGPTGWQEVAACRGHDPEAFFPISERAGTPSVEQARAICSRCPVVDACREWALVNQPFGIAGGLTTDERTKIRRARRAAGQLVTAGGDR